MQQGSFAGRSADCSCARLNGAPCRHGRWPHIKKGADSQRVLSEITKVQTDPLVPPGSQPDFELLLQAYRKLETDPADAVKIWTSLAERGSPQSMVYLGSCFSNGLGVEKDLQCAEKWFRAAADLGVVRAHYSLGRLYLDAQRYAEAKQEFESAASKGFVPADHLLGRIYYNGYGVPVDRARAKAHLETASNWGCVFAKTLLAYDLRHEQGGGALACLKGNLMRLEATFDLIRILSTDGFTSDRLR